ncbi:hypothetical protein QTP88_009783 [Uroleucon formosanum]
MQLHPGIPCQSATEENAFRDICIFLITIYVEAWFRCPAAIEAPYNDFIFLKKLIEYPDKAISETATHKFCGHLWYLAPESIALSFFDFRVPTEIKIKMVEALKSTQNNDDTIKKIVLSKEVSADNIDAMRQSMYRERRKLLPPVPVSLSDALNKVKESNITLNNGEQFVFVNESAKIIIVTCKTNLQFLCNEIEFILADGTFTYCPKHFYQQYTIHGVCKQYYVPLVFCFLPSKTKDIYKQMWETLKDLCLNNANSVFQPSLLLLDFELSAHIAVKEVFPLIIIKACRFHLGQAWYRKISSIPILKKNYNDKNSQSGLWLKLFFGLPYLPSHMISEAFIEIMATCPDEKQYYDFADYILDNYIETNHFSPILWAEEPNKSTRTTNGAESYHSQLRHEFYVPHPTIFHSINVLKQQQIISEPNFDLYKMATTNLFFQQHGAPAHNAIVVREYLQDKFGNRWMGTYGAVAWPPRSPDLTPLDFFLWRHLKNEVYSTPPLSIQDLKNKIVIACAELKKEQILAATQREVIRRFQSCMENDGQNFEQFIT